MSDLLVKIYALPPWEQNSRWLAEGGTVRRAMPPEFGNIVTWVGERFGERWRSETWVGLSAQPAKCFLALDSQGLLAGFVLYDVTFRGFLGPLGVDESSRGRGAGTVLLRRGLAGLADGGFAYAIIGWSSDDRFYQRTVGALPIPDSEPGPYEGMC